MKPEGPTMLLKALPFAFSFTMAPMVAIAVTLGGWWIALPFFYGWVCIGMLDQSLGLDTKNMDPATEERFLFWHKAVIWAWAPIQTLLIIYSLWTITSPGHMTTSEQVFAALALGIPTGAIGITFAHELVHQRNKWERWLGEFLLVSVGYGHFATEHVYGHHLTVGTPKDPVSARKGQGFYAFFARAVLGSFVSAWKIDQDRLARRGRAIWHRTNPWWRYMLGLGAWLAFAVWLAGPWGIALFAIQCFMAVYQLEAVNYVEHYGLCRKYLGNGKFERVQPHHSWNASHKVSNWMLINLQRHSDHHFRPDRRFPLLQHYSWQEAPQLPHSYPAMVGCALLPPLWFWIMNRRVDRWRARFYPDVTDWSAYEDGTIGRESVGNGAALPA
ncbi:MAG: alkane 1-monooxygenase [Paracoccaceae bacterium]